MTGKLEAIGVEVGVLHLNREPPGGDVLPMAGHKLPIVHIGKHRTGRTTGGPQINRVVLIVGGSGTGWVSAHT